jgi:hypothetical protein
METWLRRQGCSSADGSRRFGVSALCSNCHYDLVALRPRDPVPKTSSYPFTRYTERSEFLGQR